MDLVKSVLFCGLGLSFFLILIIIHFFNEGFLLSDFNFVSCVWWFEAMKVLGEEEGFNNYENALWRLWERRRHRFLRRRWGCSLPCLRREGFFKFLLSIWFRGSTISNFSLLKLIHYSFIDSVIYFRSMLMILLLWYYCFDFHDNAGLVVTLIFRLLP